MAEALVQLADALKKLTSDGAYTGTYSIPARWLNPAIPAEGAHAVNPFTFYHERVLDALALEDRTSNATSTGGDWSRYAVVYNIFVRQTTAWDHDGNGAIELGDLPGGFRETGTFLKTLALLPYFRNLGINTIHLLPITSIGSDGNKGSLGSPYAIKNPYEIDERLGEPCLGLDVKTQFKAFVEAAHRFGMRVVVEFVFRTAAKDSDWIPEHPDWFYWIDAAVPDRDPANPLATGYGNPVFPADTLAKVKEQVEKKKSFKNLPPPPKNYRELFAEPPFMVELIDGRYIGTTVDGRKVRIPGAFADWPPDDVQPPWGDVTYLKMYRYPEYNYIAYNTIRMYEETLAVPANEQQELWNHILNVVPYYQEQYAIDGVMIDMGHALPKNLMKAIVARARDINPDFAFWEENFALTKKSREEGYNITMGYLWSDEHEAEKLKAFCEMLQQKGSPVPFFATPETHNTPRAASRPGGIVYSKLAATLNALMPGVLFLHQGYELGDTLPVNTGLGFTPEDLERLPSWTLPLFSEAALEWNNPASFQEYLSELTALRHRWSELICNPSPTTFNVGVSSNPSVLCFVRVDSERNRAIGVVANLDCLKSASATVSVPGAGNEIIDMLTDRRWKRTGERFSFSLQPGEAHILRVQSQDK